MLKKMSRKAKLIWGGVIVLVLVGILGSCGSGGDKAAVTVLERWFRFWPSARIRFDDEPARMLARLTAARNRLAAPGQDGLF